MYIMQVEEDERTRRAALLTLGLIFFGHDKGCFAMVFTPANAANITTACQTSSSCLLDTNFLLHQVCAGKPNSYGSQASQHEHSQYD